MLKRKITNEIIDYLQSGNDMILLVEGARQIGKSYSIREAGKQVFPHFVELNFVTDDEGAQIFKNVHTTEEFYLKLGAVAGKDLDTRENTLVFLDEIQHYPQFLTLLKFLREEGRYRYIASGSLLGLALRETTSIPVGSVMRKQMYQLDFEEFLWANNMGEEAIHAFREKFHNRESLSEDLHKYLLDLFKRYLLVGGMPAAVNEYLASHNIYRVREVHEAIRHMYIADATQYEKEANKTLLIRRIYEMVPSQMENKKKRMVAKDISGKKGDRFANYTEEFEYLISSGISLAVHAVSNPIFPLRESLHKNLLKLYLNDVGMLTASLYQENVLPILNDERSVNLGAIYESVVAQELAAHGNRLFYYDNRKKGEVDFMVDDYSHTSILPIEVKSGKDYTSHAALDRLVTNPDYPIKQALVLSNAREVRVTERIIYLPIYYIMFVDRHSMRKQSSMYF